MSDHTVKRLDEMDSRYGGAFKLARAALGVTSFGMAVVDLPPGFDQYPEHDHRGDGQEEVFLALRGSGELEVDGERVPLDPETFVRVGPTARRRPFAGPDGMRLLILGAVPGAPYVAPTVSEPENLPMAGPSET